MPKEIFPSSFECDCGYQAHFFESTVEEMKAMSLRSNKKVYLGDSAPGHHTIVFYQGKMVEILCPGKSKRVQKKSRARYKKQ